MPTAPQQNNQAMELDVEAQLDALLDQLDQEAFSKPSDQPEQASPTADSSSPPSTPEHAPASVEPTPPHQEIGVDLIAESPPPQDTATDPAAPPAPAQDKEPSADAVPPATPAPPATQDNQSDADPWAGQLGDLMAQFGAEPSAPPQADPTPTSQPTDMLQAEVGEQEVAADDNPDTAQMNALLEEMLAEAANEPSPPLESTPADTQAPAPDTQQPHVEDQTGDLVEDSLASQIQALIDTAPSTETAPSQTPPPSTTTHEPPDPVAEESAVLPPTPHDDSVDPHTLDQIDQMLADQADLNVSDQFDTPGQIETDESGRYHDPATEAASLPTPDDPSSRGSPDVMYDDASYLTSNANAAASQSPDSPPAGEQALDQQPSVQDVSATGGFTADAQSVARELDEQPERQAVPAGQGAQAKTTAPRVRRWWASIVKLIRSSIAAGGPTTRKLLGWLNHPLTKLSPSTRDAIGYFALLHLFVGSVLIIAKLTGIL